MSVQQDLHIPDQSRTKSTSITEPTIKKVDPIGGNNISVFLTICKLLNLSTNIFNYCVIYNFNIYFFKFQVDFISFVTIY